MVPAEFDYERPHTLAEAIALLQTNGGARALAGGHALLPAMKLRRILPPMLVDLSRIAELHGIRLSADRVHIGAMTTSSEIEHSAVLSKHAPLLSCAARVISDPLIRNRATLGGSLAQADQGGDWPAIALAAEAEIHVVGPEGQRTVPAETFFIVDDRPDPNDGTGGLRTALGPGEIITTVSVPAVDARSRHVYRKRTHPASGYALLGVAVSMRLDHDNVCNWCRIGITGAGRIASRAHRSEQLLTGHAMTPETVAEAGRGAVEGIQFVGDAFGSSAYRRQVLPIEVQRALTDLRARMW